MYQKHFQTILKALHRNVRDFYRERLVTLAVFGSVGRGTPRPDSDIDFLVIAEDLPRGRMRRVEEFATVEQKLAPLLDKMGEYGINTSLSPVFKMPDEVLQGSLLFLDMIEDSLLLDDRNCFFSRYLAALGEKLERLGARKLKHGGAWYWVLKENYKVGEEFEL